MKKINVIVLVCAVLTLLGSLLPLATKGGIYIDLSHMSGLVYLLFVLPVYLLVVSIIALNGKISSLKSWYLPATITGLMLTLIACYAGLQQLESIAQFSNGIAASVVDVQGESLPGVGAIILAFGYLASSIAAFFNKSSNLPASDA